MKVRITMLLLLVISVANAAIIAPPTNDECSSAIELTVNNDFLCNNVATGTVKDATPSPQAAGCFGTGSKDGDDVWYKFVATKTHHQVDLLNISGDETNMFFGVYDGGVAPTDCNSQVVAFCSSSNSQDYSGFIVGNTYFVRVFTNSTLNNHNTTFELCISTDPNTPDNDDCANASVISSLPFSANVDASAATNNLASVTPSGGTSCSTMNDGVWYKFIGDGNQITVRAQPNTTWDLEIGVYTGTCGTFTCVVGSDTGSPGTVEEVSFNSINGTEYFVNIGHKNDVEALEGAFTLQVTSTVLSIDKLIAKGFTYYPNPISNKLNLQAKEEIRHLEVYNTFGQKLRLFSPSELKTDINLSDLPTGPYFIRAYVGDAVGMFKIIKK